MLGEHKKRNLLVIFIVAIPFLYIGYSFLRNRAEDGHHEQLKVGKPSTSTEVLNKLISTCVLSTLPEEKIASGMIGISDTPWPPDAKKYYLAYKDLNIHWNRAAIDWGAIEKPDGTYDWSSSDFLVRNSHDNGITLLADIIYQPTNIRTWEEMQQHFKRFTNALVLRYKPGGTFAKENNWETYGVSYWEVLNEPNLPGWGWLSSGWDPKLYVREYTALLAVANKAIHDADPPAVVILGGVSSDDVNRMPYTVFFEQLYSYNSSQCFDIIAFHPYGKHGKFGEPAKEIQTIELRHGNHIKPLWYNEYGTDQDKDLEMVMKAMFAERNAADAWFWFTLRDLRPNHRWTYGLTDYNFVPKSVYYIFKTSLSK